MGVNPSRFTPIQISLSPSFLSCFFERGVRRSLRKREELLCTKSLGNKENVFGFVKITSLYFHIFLCFLKSRQASCAKSFFLSFGNVLLESKQPSDGLEMMLQECRKPSGSLQVVCRTLFFLFFMYFFEIVIGQQKFYLKISKR